MVALLKYGSGVPFYRLERTASERRDSRCSSTQWEIVAHTAQRIRRHWTS